MDISVIVPIYKVEKYIEKSLHSLFSQTKVDDVEFILVNDKTPDQSMSIAKTIAAEYPHVNVRFFDMDINKGIAAVRQQGIDLAIGEYTIQIDSDDWCEPTMLEDLWRVAKLECADIVVCDYYRDKLDGQSVYRSQPSYRTAEDWIKGLLREELYGAMWNKFIKRSLYLDNKIEYKEGINIAEDFYVVIQLFNKASNIFHHPKAYLHYTERSNSIISSLKMVDMFKLYEQIDLCLLQSGALSIGYTYDFYLRVNKLKLYLILQASYLEFKMIAKCMPQSNKYILKTKEFKIHQRLLLYLACNHLVLPAYLISRIMGVRSVFRSMISIK